MWEPSGVQIGTIKGGGARRHTSDGEGGAYIGHGRWIQHISVEGELSWQGEGAPYTLRPSVFSNSSQTRNGSKGIWNFWSQDTGGFSSLDIYGQYIDSSGNVKWESNGKPICIVEHLQDWAKAASVNDGTAIVVWMDYRNNRTNVFAAKVDAEGIITKAEDQGEMLPSTPYLEQNYPNPFNPTTTIVYSIPEASFVELKIYDILGGEVATLVKENKLSGKHSLKFNASNLPSGIYFYRIVSGNFTTTKKLIILK